VAYFKVGGTEESHETSQSRKSVLGRIFKRGTSRKRCRNGNNLAMTLSLKQ